MNDPQLSTKINGTEPIFRGFGLRPTGRITVREVRVPPGERLEFTWEGGRIAAVDLYHMTAYAEHTSREGNIVRIGPYRTRVLREHDFTRDCMLVLYLDRWAWLYRLRFFVQTHAHRFNIRLLHTLNIWQLAHTPMGAIPSWKDVIIVRHILVYLTARKHYDRQ